MHTVLAVKPHIYSKSISCQGSDVTQWVGHSSHCRGIYKVLSVEFTCQCGRSLHANVRGVYVSAVQKFIA